MKSAATGRLDVTIQAILDRLARTRFTAANEERLQHGVGEILDGLAPAAFERELRLNPRDRPDFFARELGIAVEVKWGTSGGSVQRVVAQLARYAEHDAVKVILLATPSRRVAANVPNELLGVPVERVVLLTGY